VAKVKKVQDLKEDVTIRTVKFHFHRFAKFLRYLKEQDAVVELSFPDEDGKSTYKQVYTARKRDGNPSIEDLVAEALNISGGMAREYTSRKLGLDDTHADVDKIYATGKVIDAITFYTASSDSIDESRDLLTSPHPFRVRCHDPLHSNFDYAKSETDRISDIDHHPLIESFRQFPVHVLMNLSMTYNQEKSLIYATQHGSPFSLELHELTRVYGNSLEPNDEASSKLITCLKTLESYYYRFYERKEGEYPILADYLDFTIPCSTFHARRSAYENIGDISVFLQNSNHSLNDFIPHRYEILWSLSMAHYPVSEWPIQCQALLLLAHAEYIATESMILDCIDQIMKDLRFIIYCSEDSQGLNLQRDSLSLSDLSEVLTRYNFKNGIENTITIEGTNLLKYAIMKFPEPHASKGGYSAPVIEELISNALKKHLDIRIRKDLNITKRP